LTRHVSTRYHRVPSSSPLLFAVIVKSRWFCIVMAVSLADPETTTAAYESIIQSQSNWLLLGYDNDKSDHLSLFAKGSQGLPELKSKILDDLDQVFIGFYREEAELVNPGFILINYIPHSVSSVRRGMCSRRCIKRRTKPP